MPSGTRLTEERYAGRFVDDRRLDVVEELIAHAGESGHTILDLAFTWLLAHRAVASVIAGATQPEQVRANVAAGTTSWRLSQPELAAIDEIVMRTA